MCYFKMYYSVLCTYCYRFVRLEDAEEIVQDVMLWLWENRERPIIEYSLKQYLFKAVYHRCMTRIAQNEVKQRADTAYYERMFAMLQEVDIYQINELSKHIQRAINELPPTYREAFIMHRFQNLSYKEAAELLNVSPKTVDYRNSAGFEDIKGQAERLSATDIDAPAHLALRPYTSRTSLYRAGYTPGLSPKEYRTERSKHPDVLPQYMGMFSPKTTGCITPKTSGCF